MRFNKKSKIKHRTKFITEADLIKGVADREIDAAFISSPQYWWFLKNNPDKKVEIQGHASLDGDRKYNRKLSEQRAFAVAQLLIEQFGIAPNRVQSFGYGIDQPRVNEISVRANAANRRIEAVITDS